MRMTSQSWRRDLASARPSSCEALTILCIKSARMVSESAYEYKSNGPMATATCAQPQTGDTCVCQLGEEGGLPMVAA